MNFEKNNENIIKEIKSLNKEIIFVCIGTDNHVWDSLGPMVGTMLKEKNFDVEVYGDLNNPITTINVDSVKETLDIERPASIIIAIDVAVSTKIDLNKCVYVKKGGVKPGLGVGVKNLKVIGDYSILYYVFNEDMGNKRIRLPFNGALEILKVVERLLN